MAERGQSSSSIRRLLIGYLLVIALLGGGVAVATVLLVRAADRDRALALIDSDIAETMEKIGRDPATQADRALAIVLARSSGGGDRLYRLSRGDVRLAGLSDAVGFVARDGLLQSQNPDAVARTVPLAGGVELLFARRLQQGALTSRLLWVAGGTLVLAVLIAGGVGYFASRRLGARVAAINRACDAVRLGDLSARAPHYDQADEFALLARHVNDMLARIDALVTGLRDVSNRIAHDLRTPVARLKTSIEQAAHAKELGEARSLAGAAAAETDAILQTFEALLDIAEVEAGSTGGLSPVRLDEAVQSALDLYDSVAEASEIRLVTDLAPATIIGERMLVIRLAANLIDNAIKFSHPGGAVSVSIARCGGEALLRVADSGPGIAPADRDRVLGRFQRGEATRHVPGYGLGLALVSAVAKRHGAKVSLDDAKPGVIASVRFESFEA